MAHVLISVAVEADIVSKQGVLAVAASITTIRPILHFTFPDRHGYGALALTAG